MEYLKWSTSKNKFLVKLNAFYKRGGTHVDLHSRHSIHFVLFFFTIKNPNWTWTSS